MQNDALAADVDLRSADIVRAQAELARAQSDVSRRQQLAKSGGVSGEEILHAEAALKSAQSGSRPRRAGRRARQARHQPALTRGTDVGDPARPGLRNAAGAIAHRAARAGRWRGGAQRPSASVSPRAPR